MNENDRELLKMAAKAAGFYWIDQGGEHYGIADGSPEMYCDRWDPLTDDGDALRLAVKLNLQITPGTYNKEEATAYGEAEAHERVHYLQDLCAATRRAIVRAAAKIGSAL